MVNLASKRLGFVLPVALLLGGCESGELSETTQTASSCPAASSRPADQAREGVVVVRGDDPACEVRFVLVQELTGSLTGTLPRFPITAGPGGRWLSATYSNGEFAVWSPSGRLEQVIGVGSGDGPGEFGRVSDLVVDSVAGTIHVFSNSPRVEVFSFEGEHVEGVRLPSPALAGTLVSDGTIASSTAIPSGGPRVLLITRDSTFRVGPARRMPMPAEVRAGGVGVWTAESPWYQIDHQVLPSGEVDFSVRREIDWFPVPSPEEGRKAAGPQMMGFTVNHDRRMIFARVMPVGDLGAPARRPLGGGGGEQPLQMRTRPMNGVLEVFSFDGDLVASRRYEDGQDMPWPLGAGAPTNLWYRVTDGITQSIEILRPELVSRARDQ